MLLQSKPNTTVQQSRNNKNARILHPTPGKNNTTKTTTTNHSLFKQFDENDDLPRQICQHCIHKTEQTYNFINTCKLVNETYKKCLTGTDPQIKVETIFLEPMPMHEEYLLEVKQEPETPDEDNHRTLEHQYTQNPNILMDFVRLGKQFGCKSLLMRYFTEREGAERLSMHFCMTSFIDSNFPQNYDGFMELCRREMTDEQCAAASEETLRKNTELNLELCYGRITSSKIYMVSCCEIPDEYFIETVIGFYKINERKTSRVTELIVQKIEKQLNVKINKRGLILNRKYPEFVAKIDGVTDDAVIKMKFPKHNKDFLKYIDNDKNLKLKAKMEMHLLMLMTNLRTGYLCLIDPNFANTNTIIKVDFNERYFAEVLRKSQAFWMTKIYPALLKTVT